MPGTHAFGTTLTWNAKVVGGLSIINGIEISVDSTEITTHESADAYREFIPTLIDAGDVSVEGFMDPTDTDGQIAMVADANAKATRTAIITFPASTKATWNFSGFITRIKIGDAPVDGAIPFSATIKVTGKPTFAVATS